MHSRFRQHLSKYLFVFVWLMRDFVLRYKGSIAAILGFRFVGLGCQLGTFGLLAYYAQLLEADATVTIGNDVVRARESLGLLAGLGATALTALAASSVFILLSNRWATNLSGEYEELCGRRAMEIAGASIRLEKPDRVQVEDEKRLILKLVRRYPRMIRRVVRIMLSSLIPALLTAALFLPVLFILNPWLSLIVIALSGASLFAHYRLSIKTANCTVVLERTSKEASQIHRSTIDRFAHHLDSIDQPAIDANFNADSVREDYRAFATRLLATDKSQFLSDLTTAVILVIVLVVLGGNIMTQGEGWSSLIVYLLALRYTMSQLKSALTGTTGINRFFHQSRAYFLFVESEHETLPSRCADGISELTLRCNADRPLSGCQHEIVAKPGDRIVLIAPYKPSRFHLHLLFTQILDDDPEAIRSALSNARLEMGQCSSASIDPEALKDKSSRSSILITGSNSDALEINQGETDNGEVSSNDIILVGQTRFKPASIRPADIVVLFDGDRVVWLGRGSDALSHQEEFNSIVDQSARTIAVPDDVDDSQE